MMHLSNLLGAYNFANAVCDIEKCFILIMPITTHYCFCIFWKGLKLGYLQEVSTDHCPFHFKGQKELGRGDFRKIPNGGPGVLIRVGPVVSVVVLSLIGIATSRETLALILICGGLGAAAFHPPAAALAHRLGGDRSKPVAVPSARA